MSKSDAKLLRSMQALWLEADKLWQVNENAPEFQGFVAADYEQVFQSLVALRDQVVTVLEWGSGLGVVAIMASRLGFEAHGIEAEPRLVDLSRDLASKYHARAEFWTGNFIPDAYRWDAECVDEDFRTALDLAAGYDDFELELRDFDLVYAYPWPTERAMYFDIMRKCGGSHALLMLYDAREGISVDRVSEKK